MNIDYNNDAKVEMERTMSLNEDVADVDLRLEEMPEGQSIQMRVPRRAVIARTVAIVVTVAIATGVSVANAARRRVEQRKRIKTMARRPFTRRKKSARSLVPTRQ